jgi:long-chain acyl-CoA synthetase
MEATHLAELVFQQTLRHGAREAVFFKQAGQWRGISWLDYGQRIQATAKALLRYGIAPGDRIAIFSENRPEWSMTDYGVMSVRAVTVPIYASSTPSQAAYILADAEARLCFVSKADKARQLLPLLNSMPRLEKILVFDGDVQEQDDPRLMKYEGFLEEGRNFGSDADVHALIKQAQPDELCTIIYTSGTTGEPKGVMLTHRNLLSQVEAIDQFFPLDQNDVDLEFLPLSHAYARVSCYWVQSHGAQTYYCDDPKKVVSYLQEVRPTFMVGVPRFYEKIYAAAQHKMNHASFLERQLFAWALKLGRSWHEAHFNHRSASLTTRLQFLLADRLVLQKIRGLLGGRIRYFSAGGAPLSKEIEEFFFACGIFIAQGYGLTETSPIISCNRMGSFKFGSTGQPIPGCDVKIADDGEILVKGINVTPGYFHRPEANRETFDAEGWFHTGDIGRLDEEGFLYVTDRKKDLIVTANGKKIAPQKVEKYLGSDYYIEQVVCFGDRRKYITALIVPAFDAVEEHFKEQGLVFPSREAMIADERVMDFIQSRINLYASNFADFELVKSFRLLPREFSMDQGEITPTLKIRRKVVQSNYAPLIEAMYHNASSPKAPEAWGEPRSAQQA